MWQTQTSSEPTAPSFHTYGSVSASLINRPNPVEPDAAPRKHHLHDVSRFNPSASSSVRDLGCILRDNATAIPSGGRLSNESPDKRRKVDHAKSLDLPKLPLRSGKSRRPRLPPTLSGLHQPPPNAGLLPSLSVKQPAGNAPAEQQDPTASARNAGNAPPSDDATEKAFNPTERSKSSRNKWSEEETACLLKGVARFGIGNWTKVLKCPDYRFQRRTALDLKDRFRVCCPQQYKKSKPDTSDPPDAYPDKAQRSDRMAASDLADLGIKEPFKKALRRQRHAYSAAEDEALLNGFRIYGNAWARIRNDTALPLNHRTPTDLRDRMRTRFPGAYKEAGLKGRPNGFPASVPRAGKQQRDIEPDGAKEECRHQTIDPLTEGMIEKPAQETQQVEQASFSKSATATFFTTDPYLTLPLDDEELDAEPITLDRGILDWALVQSGAAPDSSGPTLVDPPSNIRHISHSSHQPYATSIRVPTINAAPSLPSLATVTASGASMAGAGFGDEASQSELPSFMQCFGQTLDGEDRTGAQTFPSLEELLS